MARQPEQLGSSWNSEVKLFTEEDASAVLASRSASGSGCRQRGQQTDSPEVLPLGPSKVTVRLEVKHFPSLVKKWCVSNH